MELFKLFGTIAINNSEANEGIAETTSNASSLSEKLKSGIGTAAKWGSAVVGGAAAVGAAVIAVTENTKEYRTEMGKLDTAFQTAGHSTEAARQTYSELNSVLGDSGQAVEAANHLAKLCQTEQELQSWTDICTGVYATFGASLPIEGLTESANETAKVGQITGSLADALNWAGVSEDEFNASLAACSTEQERQQLITDTLTGLYKEASDQYKENNADVIEANKAQQSLTDTMAKFGEIAQPAVTKVMNVVAKILPELLPLVDAVAEQVIPALMPILESILPPIIQLIQTLMPILSELSSILVGVVKIAVDIVSDSMDDLTGILNGVIQFVKGVFTGDWKAAWEGVKNIFSSIVGMLGSIFKKPLNVIIGAVNTFISGLNKIKIPDWVPGVGGKGINIATIPYLEKGGVLERGQVGFLEGNGAEAVVPLDQNKKWVSAVAEDMNRAIGGDNEKLQKIVDLLETLIDILPATMIEAFKTMKFDVNNREFARLVKAVN